jgi:hypothetical protein
MDASNEVDTIAYAATFCKAAELLLPHMTDSNLSGPFFTLIGGALENAFKAALEFRNVEPRRSWSHSHDLTRLRKYAEDVGLELDEADARCVDAISVPHLEFQFRYPQGAGSPVLPSAVHSAAATYRVIDRVFRMIGGHQRLSEPEK